MTKLDREKGTKALNEGFVMIFGEHHRELLETKGEELIELGIKNGKSWIKSEILKDNRISFKFEMEREGHLKKGDIEELENDMQVYFTPEEIIMLKNGSNKSIFFTDGVEKYIKLFRKKIPESDIKIVSAKPFDHFKEYVINDKYKITLFDEGGLQLDNYKKKELKYYQQEGELFYMIEDIARKYHYFGMLLAKDAELELWIEKIKNNLTQNTNYWLKTSLSQIIYKLITNEKYADEIIIDIQNHTGVTDGFITYSQLNYKLSQFK